MTDAEPTWMTYRPEEYDALLAEKVAATRAKFGDVLGDVEPEPFASSPSHFRQRARFVVARFGDDQKLSYALFDKGSPSLAVTQFPTASRAINELMPRLIAAVDSSPPLSDNLAAVHFLSTQSDDMLVTLIYAAPLPTSWRSEAEELKRSLGLPALLGRAKGECVALDREWVDETYTLDDGRRLTYRQMEGSFSNPSAAMCERTLSWLLRERADRWLQQAEGQLRAILVDPPRCGLDAKTRALVATFEHVVYISCNPDALLRDLHEGGLAASHAPVKFAIFDHFPYTRHLECAVYMRRRRAST